MKVVVLGAGVVGVSTAWFLAKAGHEVIVIDRQAQAGIETSYANGGQISVSQSEPWANPGTPMRALKWMSKEDAPLLFRWRFDSRQWSWALKFLTECRPGRAKQNIRQLEGAVKKLNAYSMLEGIEPCIGVTTTAIKDTLNDSQPIPVTIEKILNEVARTYNVMPSDIRGKKRNANVSAARQMTMYIIREVTGMSMEAIGQEFQRDHSTVVYSIKTMEENIKRDQHLKEMCSDIMKNVRT